MNFKKMRIVQDSKASQEPLVSSVLPQFWAFFFGFSMSMKLSDVQIDRSILESGKCIAPLGNSTRTCGQKSGVESRSREMRRGTMLASTQASSHSSIPPPPHTVSVWRGCRSPAATSSGTPFERFGPTHVHTSSHMITHDHARSRMSTLQETIASLAAGAKNLFSRGLEEGVARWFKLKRLDHTRTT